MINLFFFVLPALTAVVLAWLLTPPVARLAVRVGAVDMPGDRKIHTTPVPRLGGLAVVASIAVVLTAAAWLSRGRWHLPSHFAAGITAGVLPIFLVSLADDLWTVSARKKLVAHAIGAVVAVNMGLSLGPVVHLFGSPIYIGWLAAPLSVVWIVGVTNAFNIIDGLDGLSAGLALISAISMASVFALVGQPEMAGVSLVLAGALAGFLPYNVYPARLFLGDAGATTIGFCLASFALKGGSTLSSGFAALLPVFVLGLPIADTLIAMARRTLHRLEFPAGGGIMAADSNHIHHRLLQLGVGHRKAVFILYAAGLAFAAAAFVSVFLNARQAAFVVAAVLLAGLVGVQRLGYEEFAFLRRGTVLRVYEMPAVKRGFFIVFVDLALAFAAAYLAVGLKTDTWSPSIVGRQVVEIATALAPLTVVAFYLCGLYRGSWRVAGLHDLTRVLIAVTMASAAGDFLLSLASPHAYQHSAFAIYGLVSLLLTASLRASYVILENAKLRSSHRGVPVLIYGAGGRGVAAVRELFQTHTQGLRPVGFIDDDVRKRGRIVTGLPVLGTWHELERALTSSGAQGVVISSEKIAVDRIAATAQMCAMLGASLYRLDITVERLHDSNELLPAEQASSELRSATFERMPSMEATAGLAGRSSEPCPSCSSTRLQRSKARNVLERFGKMHTYKRIYRCLDCPWRGWLMPLQFGKPSAATSELLLDLDQLPLDPSVKPEADMEIDLDRPPRAV